MPYKFAKRALNVPNSGIDFMMTYASKYKDVISLGQGTPLFRTPEFIFDYLHERSKTDPTVGRYSSPQIENELLELIRGQMEKIYGFKPKTEELYLTIGGIGALFATLMMFLEKNDEVIYFDPGYPLHLSQIHLTEAKPVFVPLMASYFLIICAASFKTFFGKTE